METLMKIIPIVTKGKVPEGFLSLIGIIATSLFYINPISNEPTIYHRENDCRDSLFSEKFYAILHYLYGCYNVPANNLPNTREKKTVDL